jgi:hypothetical protein
MSIYRNPASPLPTAPLTVAITATSSAAKPRRAQHPKKKKKKKKKKKSERKGDSSYRGTDSSTGDDKRIHGFEVSGVAIDKALVPAGLVSKDRVSLVETAVDVAALPGFFFGSTFAGV